MKVPFLNLKAQYDAIGQELDIAIKEVISNCAFSGGPYVERFEDDFAKFCGTSCAVGVSSGTEALWLALLGLGVQPGDEVITAPNSFIATAEAISLCGAEPVFVDVEESSFTINPSLIEQAITPRTKVIIPVHLFGQTANMDPILEVARGHGLAVVEDACQAHGAEYKGKRAGSIGMPDASASIQERIWARMARRGGWSPATGNWRTGSDCCGITAKPESITTKSLEPTVAWMASRGPS